MKKQKMICLGLATLLLAGIASAGSNLILDEKDGLTEKPEVQSYDGRKKTVKVRTGSGAVSQPLGSFSEANQQKIIGWYTDRKFKSSSGLHVSLSQKKEDGFDPIYGGEITRQFYELEIENRTSVELRDIQISYLAFYEEQQGLRNQWVKYRVEESLDINFSEGEKKSLVIEPMDDYVRYSTNGFGWCLSDLELELKGVRVCVHRIDSRGQRQEKVYEKGRLPRESQRSSYKKAERSGDHLADEADLQPVSGDPRMSNDQTVKARQADNRFLMARVNISDRSRATKGGKYVRYIMLLYGCGDLGDIRADCSIFYRRDRAGRRLFRADSTEFFSLISSKSHSAISSPAVYLSDYSTDTGGSARDLFEGVLLRLSRRNMHGELVVREFEEGRVPSEKERKKYRVDSLIRK